MGVSTEVEGLDNRADVCIDQNTEEAVAQLDPVHTDLAQVDLVYEIGLCFRRGRDAVFGQLTGNQCGRKKQRVVGRLPRLLPALLIDYLPRGPLAAYSVVGNLHHLIRPRVKTGGLLDADGPSVRS